MSAPRPYVTNPFHPLGSFSYNKLFTYIYQNVPILSSKWYEYICLGMVGNKQLRMCFSKTLSPRLRTIIQVILISILYVPACMVFFQAHVLKKKKNRSATTWCPPMNYLSLFLCVIAKQIENKDKKARTTLESHYARKRPGNITSHFKNGTIFNRWQKWPFCKGYSKANGHKWSILGLSQKNIRKPTTP